MSAYTIIEPASLPLGEGPHPAASPFDRRVSEALGISSFEAYVVDLPPGESTVDHDHVSDHVDDVYVILVGAGWVVVDDEPCAVAAGQWIAVDVEARRFVRAGERGMEFIAVCAPRRAAHTRNSQDRRSLLRRLVRRTWPPKDGPDPALSLTILPR